MVAGKIAKLQHGGDRSSGQLAACPTQEQAAEMLNVGERSVRRAREVLDDGVSELAEKVERGEISVSAAPPNSGRVLWVAYSSSNSNSCSS